MNIWHEIVITDIRLQNLSTCRFVRFKHSKKQESSQAKWRNSHMFVPKFIHSFKFVFQRYILLKVLWALTDRNRPTEWDSFTEIGIRLTSWG